MSITGSSGSPGQASDFVGNNMYTWDVARALINNKAGAGSSNSFSTAAAAALLLQSYAFSSSSSTPGEDRQQQIQQQQQQQQRPDLSVEGSYREPVVDVPTDRVQLVLCASNCGCSAGSCSQGSSKKLDRVERLEEKEEIASEVEEEEEEIVGSTEVDDVESLARDSTSSREGYDMTEVEAEQLLFGYGALSAIDSAFNGSFDSNNDSYDGNSSLYNDTYIVEGLYPSGYGLPHIILASIIVTLMMIVIVIGNMLVIIAIATEKALKNISNWFIASLAVADFFLGLVIMPFSLANEIMGYWIFGYWWCDIHSAMDVLLCTASIMNLCLISLDRYWSITQAVKYLKKRTPARSALMIAMVWVLSAVICIPPLLGWKRSAPEEEYPKCKHWDGTLFYGNHKIYDDESCTHVDDLRFKLGFDHIELINSVIEEKPNVLLISSIGNLKTLSMTFTFKLSDTKINGKIQICSVLNQSLQSTYKLHLTKVKIKSIVGLYISEDSYRVDHIIHEFIDGSISLMYKKDAKMVPVYNKVQDKDIKHSLVQYIVSSCTKSSIAMIEDKLRLAFDLTSVSISLGNSFSFRDTFRIHVKRMKVAFNNLADEIIDAANVLHIKQVPKVSLPNVSIILNFKKDEKKSLQLSRNSLAGLNFLLRKKNTVVFMENDLVLVYVPVDFADLNLEYRNVTVKYGDKEYRATNIQEHYKTDGSYLAISVKKLGKNRIDLNLLGFKISNFILLDSDDQCIDSSIRSWINDVLEFKVAPVIEETFEKYLRIVMTHDKFTTLDIVK